MVRTLEFEVSSPPDSIKVLRESVLTIVSEDLFVGDGILSLKDGTSSRGSPRKQVTIQLNNNNLDKKQLSP